jgi:hypothetical protein
MIIGGFAARVRILLEKGPSRHHILEDQEILENTRKLYFTRRLKKLEGGGERSHRAGDVWRVVNDYYGQAVEKLQAESMMSTSASLFPQ